MKRRQILSAIVHKAICLISLSLLYLIPCLGETGGMPALNTFKFVSGRSANRDDINKGAALFVLEQDGVPIGKALKISLPQYAFHLKKGSSQKTPCVIIQAEELNGVKIIGCRETSTNQEAVDIAENFQLLGSKAGQN